MTKKEMLRGTYCIIIHLKFDSLIKVGKLGLIDFKKGYYVYVGSALNSLESRLKRHLKDEKKLFWHVDYLLNSANAEIDEIVFAVDIGRWECCMAREISQNGTEITRFGCSDCKCTSHLFYFEDLEETIATCVNSFKKLSLNPKKLDELIV